MIFSLRGIFKLSTCTRELSLLFDKSRRSIHYPRIRGGGARERGIFLSLGSFHLTPASTFHTILCFATFNNSLNFMFRCFPFHSIPLYVLLDPTFHSIMSFAPFNIPFQFMFCSTQHFILFYFSPQSAFHSLFNSKN